MKASTNERKRKTSRYINVELYVPLVSEKGKRLSRRNLAALKKRLITKFGGLTFSPQKNKGFWRVGNSVFRDEIIIFRVLCPDNPETNNFWRRLKVELEKAWDQDHVLIMTQAIQVI